jgi:hypothetical protein
MPPGKAEKAGYTQQFGLVAVDPRTFVRTPSRAPITSAALRIGKV